METTHNFFIEIAILLRNYEKGFIIFPYKLNFYKTNELVYFSLVTTFLLVV